MPFSTDNYHYLLKKIDEFTRKYYLNLVIRGALYLLASFFASFIVFIVAEYLGRFSENIRTVLFYSFLSINTFILFYFVLRPLLSYFRLGKIISYQKAAEIIGNHFFPVRDKLLNALQLKKMADEHPDQRHLIEASINQKIEELTPVPFKSAIKLGENRKYLKYVLPPVVVIMFLGATAPGILSESTERLLKFNKKFVVKAPFNFIIKNKNRTVLQGDDFELDVKISGNEIPQDVYLIDGKNTYKLQQKDLINFKYTFKNLQRSKEFYLQANGYNSDLYQIKVQKKPVLADLAVYIQYPPYLNRKNEIIYKTGDLSVPEGSRIHWKVNTKNSSLVEVKMGSKKVFLKPASPNLFNFSKQVFYSSDYSIRPINKHIANKEFVSYSLEVTPDLRPSIRISEKRDSIDSKIIYFSGEIKDDHGFSALQFHYRVLDKPTTSVSTSVPINKNSDQNPFLHIWSLKNEKFEPGDKIEYYFEVTDNDAVNGPKKTRSETKLLSLLTETEIENRIEKSSLLVENKMEQAITQATRIKKDADKLNKDLLNKQNMSFDDRKRAAQLLEERNELEKLIQEISEEGKRNAINRENYQEQKNRIIEKQKQIENLFANVLDEKTKQLLKDIENAIEKGNKNQARSSLAKINLDSKLLEKELDRILELYKQLEFDQKLSGVIDRLDKLSDEQRKLGSETQTRPQTQKLLKDRQLDIKENFAGLKSDFKTLEEKNLELEEKNIFRNPENEQAEIDNLLDQSVENLDKNNTQKAAQNQITASERMQQLSQKLQRTQQKQEKEENAIVLEDLREMLDNLLKASFKQETLAIKAKNINLDDPEYNLLLRSQKDIQVSLSHLQDSLYALSKKAPQIETVVNREIEIINQNINLALNYLSEKKIVDATKSQHATLTSLNNLALMLSEVEDALQKAMKNAQPGGQGKQKSLSQLSKMQQQLNENMQRARQELQKINGQNSVKKEAGGEMSEQMARMAREQQIIRQALQEISRGLNKDGRGGLGNLEKLAKDMEQSETDLVNKQIKKETLIRQHEILNRMIAAENSERERELDDKRESKEALSQSPNLQSVIEEFKKVQQREIELLRTVPPTLNSFYKFRVGDYFRRLNSKQ